MPLVPTILDDKRWEDLIKEIRRLIPVYTPEWTNHNVSAPGIILIQLFAYLAYLMVYRLNRIPEKKNIAILKLLGVHSKPARAARISRMRRINRKSKCAKFKLARRPWI